MTDDSQALPTDHRGSETHDSAVGGDPSATTSQMTCETQAGVAGGGDSPPSPPGPGSDPSLEAAGWVELRMFAEMFADAQDYRKAMNNRTRSMTVDSVPLAEALESVRYSETKLGLAMKRCFRRVAPEIHAWVKETPGLGEHTFARLVGAIGHPAIAEPHHWEGEGSDRVLIADPPYLRTLSQLWSYCGVGDPNRKRRKGMTADEAAQLGNPRAKTMIHIIAEGALKQDGKTGKLRSPYRDVYDLHRPTYDTRDGWTPAHAHNAALRRMKKEILRDLWIVARQSLPGDR